MQPILTIEILQEEASKFAETETSYDELSLYDVTDGKAVGTYQHTIFVEKVRTAGFQTTKGLLDILTISNALQGGLQYSRIIQKAGAVSGNSRVR